MNVVLDAYAVIAALVGERARTEVSLGDCFALALAKHCGLALATADPDLAAVARAEDVEIVSLPDSHGRRP